MLLLTAATAAGAAAESTWKMSARQQQQQQQRQKRRRYFSLCYSATGASSLLNIRSKSDLLLLNAFSVFAISCVGGDV